MSGGTPDLHEEGRGKPRIRAIGGESIDFENAEINSVNSVNSVKTPKPVRFGADLKLNTYKLKTSSERGFVLVAVLLIVALATLAVVTTSMVAKVERTAAQNGVAMERARANALFALDAAIDQLQTVAGPDQRVSARADILASGNTTVEQPYWTGVWKSYNPANATDYQLDDPDPAAYSLRSWSYASPSWLVSNPTPGTALNISTWNGTVTGANPTAVVMAKNLPALGNATSGNATTGNATVLVPRVPLMDAAGANQTEIGAYAYWIQDEGIKAKLNLMPNAASSNATNVARYLAPATKAAELALEGNWRTSMRSFLGNNTDNLSKVKSPAMLDFVLGGNFSAASDGLAVSSPDITTHSFSLLSNVKKGGLKTDLTAAFENSGTLNQDSQFRSLFRRDVSGYVAPVFPNSAQPGVLGGLLWRVHSDNVDDARANVGYRWFTFFHHYNLYKSSLPTMPSHAVTGAPQSPAGLGGLGGNSLEPRWAQVGTAGAAAINAGALLPVVLGFKAEVAISSYFVNAGADPVSPDDDEFDLRIHYIPSLVMWNPHDVELRETIAGSNNIDYIFNAKLFQRIDQTFTINATSGNGSVSHNPTILPPSLPETFKFRIRDGEKTFAPGEIRVFGLATDSLLPPDYIIPPLTQDYEDGNFVYRNLDLIPKLRRDASITIRFPREIKTPSNIPRYQIAYANRYPQNEYSGPGTNFENPGSEIGLQLSGNEPFDFTVSGIEGDVRMQRLTAFMSRVKGRFPINSDIRIPTQGGPGSFFNTVSLQRSALFWDDLRRIGPGFLGSEQYQNGGNGLTFWGRFDLGVAGSSSSRIQYELPRTPMVSIGQFKNVRADSPGHTSMVPLGNSWATPELPLTSIFDLGPRLSNFHDNVQDDNWLNNDALFDGFYFSTVPPASRALSTAYPAEWGNNASDFDQSRVNAGAPLLNPRLKYHQEANGAAPLLADLQDMDKAAANLVLDGGFNINSTSVAAWRAVFASLRFPGQSGSAPVPRFVQTLSSAPTTEDVEAGRRVLTDEQVDALAAAMVEQVKLRGPFLTLADFVNRRLVNGDFGRKGALQAAIDASGINTAAQNELGYQSFLVPNPWSPRSTGHWEPFSSTRQASMRTLASADNYSTALGAPGMITQADLLQYLAPILTARSDTFKIRVYGEAGLTPSGGDYKKIGKAYGEAIVQRLPEFVDQADTALSTMNVTLGKVAGNATPVDALNAVNQAIGRRFKVVSFRWLSPEEI